MSNRLKEQTSPYLLQHAENPVDWFPWCDEAFEKARAEDKHPDAPICRCKNSFKTRGIL